MPRCSDPLMTDPLVREALVDAWVAIFEAILRELPETDTSPRGTHGEFCELCEAIKTAEGLNDDDSCAPPVLSRRAG
jgi:hypothetical protein